MEKDIDYLISLFHKLSHNTNKEEIGEQDAPASDSSGASGGKGNNVSKWADVVGGPKRGVANPLDKSGDKWSDMVGGPNRGVANQLN